MRLNETQMRYLYPLVMLLMLYFLSSSLITGKVTRTLFLSEFDRSSNPFGYYGSIIFFIFLLIIAAYGTATRFGNAFVH